ncbi:Heavy metal-associated isoprenylated plant protein 3 [Hirschfeldia incana]|nr:Heavy metal-associated isoprenylated plant protein 3 [Hirschfeldia incana]
MGKNNNKENKGDGGEKKTAPVTVVLKIDMHCEGCASKIVKCVRTFQGVETVKSESESGKLTVTGDVDPAKLREKLEEKTKKKVDLISPQPKKEKEKEKEKEKDNKDKPKNDEDKNKEKKPEEKKPKEAAVVTAVLKVDFHCQGCIGKIQKTVIRTKGVNGLTMDKEKQLLTVKGTMDVKKLAETLSEKLKRKVEVVPPAKKEKENGNGKESEAGDKKKGGDGGGGKDNNGGGNKGGEGVNAMEYVAAQPAYGAAYYPGGPYGYPIQSHAPQMFSDENVNACVVM